MKIVYIGCVEFSYKILEKILSFNHDFQVTGVITRESSKFNSDFVDLSKLAQGNSIPYLHCIDVNSPESLEWIEEKSPDIIFCFGWSSLLKKEVLAMPRLGVLGYHPSKLPANRGRHPLIWALVLGMESTASTFFFMDDGADDGDVLCQNEIHISYKDCAESLYEKIILQAESQVEQFLPDLVNGTFEVKKQDHSIANSWRRRFPKDGEIDFRMSSRAIYNLVRGLTRPYIGAHLMYNGNDVKVWKVIERNCDFKNIEPGKVLGLHGNKITVKTYDGAIEIVDHTFDELPKVGEYIL